MRARRIQAGLILAIGIAAFSPAEVSADENGYSFWLPGQFGSLAAAPGVPGWAMAEV
ncbi:hypothetical protein JQ597_15280 [Bradyrhizobium sp. AUGA SZCCT0177]|uniref:hypothetical protein n=1 Tax=unclassified Bradyrhizobium TaxID=2631580 RepID=UPI001BACB0CC|nr:MULTISPECIES: hypothetical protein [unclassified Bradyrhizobium]MBR1233581.1 hypothetical protein [Bradyrhizobium sp. AUGA SZCCT0182]MBR1283410.1 hypothetical protein [Bradyrhizobium sp. AUGA SZCCT0177]